MAACKDDLHDARWYRPGPDFETPSRRQRLNERYIRALRDAANAATGPLTATKYEAFRRDNPQLPNRNTLARVFGGWRQALAAAGLSDRCGPRRGPTGLVLELSSWDAFRRQQDDSRRIVEVVARLRADAGRPPTVHEYLAWRIANDKTLPCLSKVYDLFPGGWSSVKAVASTTQAA
jgi:hypothetical protein